MRNSLTTTHSTLKPYYLLWGYRKCGTTSLAHQMRAAGIAMPDWDESNIWLAREEDIAAHFEALWSDQLNAPYLVDLSTLTHLGQTPPAQVLANFGFAPEYLVCSRSTGPRWLSAYAHMARKHAEFRTLRSYLSFYEQFIGLSRVDLRQLEDDLIKRDLNRGCKAAHGLLNHGYFHKAYPEPFSANVADPHYQFRYFGETLDMLEKRPTQYTTLPLENPTAIQKWISDIFGMKAVPTRPMNRNSAFNKLRHHPKVARITQRIPRNIRQPVAHWIENTPSFPRFQSGSGDQGLECALSTLVGEMIAADPIQIPEVAHAS